MRSYITRTDVNSFVWDDVDAWVKSKERTHLVQGVNILNLGSGHSYGMLALQVNKRGCGYMIMASDDVYSAFNYVSDILLPGAVYDTVGYTQTVRKIHQISMDTKAYVWFGHCVVQFRTLRKSHDGKFYT